MNKSLEKYVDTKRIVVYVKAKANYYDFRSDSIGLTANATDYHLAHEISHSTARRVGRKLPYDREEVVAELTTSKLLKALNLNTQENKNRIILYLASWVDKIPTEELDHLRELSTIAFNYIMETIK